MTDDLPDGAGSGHKYDSVPLELRSRRGWVVWKRERRDGKWTKVPLRAVDGRTPASTTDPETWGTFEQAVACPVPVQGIGYVFSVDDPYCGLDFDDCRNPTTREVHPAVAKIILELGGGYTEISPSGKGLHVIVTAVLADGGRKTTVTPWGGKFEIYDRARYFTVTGDACQLARTEVHRG